MTTPTKPSLETCAELVRAASTIAEQLKMLALARKHGYTADQIRTYLYPPLKQAAKAEADALTP
jgi:hypothetical protein